MEITRRLNADFMSFEANHGAHSRPMAGNAVDELERHVGACQAPTYELVDRPRPGVRRAFSDAHRAGWAALHQVADYYGCPAAVPPAPARPSPIWGAMRLGRARKKLEKHIGTLEAQARGVDTQAHIVCREQLSPLWAPARALRGVAARARSPRSDAALCPGDANDRSAAGRGADRRVRAERYRRPPCQPPGGVANNLRPTGASAVSSHRIRHVRAVDGAVSASDFTPGAQLSPAPHMSSLPVFQADPVMPSPKPVTLQLLCKGSLGGGGNFVIWDPEGLNQVGQD